MGRTQGDFSAQISFDRQNSRRRRCPAGAPRQNSPHKISRYNPARTFRSNRSAACCTRDWFGFGRSDPHRGSFGGRCVAYLKALASRSDKKLKLSRERIGKPGTSSDVCAPEGTASRGSGGNCNASVWPTIQPEPGKVSTHAAPRKLRSEMRFRQTRQLSYTRAHRNRPGEDASLHESLKRRCKLCAPV